MDLFERRVFRRACARLTFGPGEVPVDFDIGTLRPRAVLPPPFPADLSERQNGKVQLVATDQALHMTVDSRTTRAPIHARFDWAAFISVDLVKGKGRFGRWSLHAETMSGSIALPLLGKPRSSMADNLRRMVPESGANS